MSNQSALATPAVIGDSDARLGSLDIWERIGTLGTRLAAAAARGKELQDVSQSALFTTVMGPDCVDIYAVRNIVAQSPQIQQQVIDRLLADEKIRDDPKQFQS